MSATRETDIAIIGGGMASIHCVEDCVKDKGVKVTAIFANPFLEFPMAEAVIFADPDEHKKWICGNPGTFQIPGADYLYDRVIKVDPVAKVITMAKEAPLKYKVLVLATGSKLPMLAPSPGQGLKERLAEVKEAAAVIKGAKTVAIYGTGAVGIEVAGDIRARNPDKRIVCISRDGGVLGSEPKEIQAKVLPVLEKMKIEVIAGTAPPEFLEPKLEPGVVKLSNGSVPELAYDVFIPSFQQGANTDFLQEAGGLDDKGRLEVNKCLQSTQFPEIFGAGITSLGIRGHPVSSRVTDQAKTCAKNALFLLKGQPLVELKDSSPMLSVPMNIKIGHGKGGYLIWNTLGPGDLLCCQPCGGGFPFCPPPCCWCLAPGCWNCLGPCCGKKESQEASIFLYNMMLPKFAAFHGYKGIGEMPPEMQQMD